jgi:hypothetical protein
MTILTIPEQNEKKISVKPTYDQQYCEKHDQRYGDHLHRCPICVGEELDGKQIEVIDYTGTLTEEDVKKLLNPSGRLTEVTLKWKTKEYKNMGEKEV